MAQFKCSHNGADLCFDPTNSTCGLTAQNHRYCICYSSNTLQADNVYLHLPNCTLPRNFYEIYIYVHALLLVLTCLCFYPLHSQPQLSIPCRHLVYGGLMHHGLMVVFALCLFLQKGNFEASVLVYALKNCVLCILIHVALNILLEPIFIGNSQDFGPTKRKLDKLQWFAVSCFLFYGCILAAFARREEYFNYLALGSLSMNSILCFLYSVFMVRTTGKMLKTLELVEGTDDAKRRLALIRVHFKFIALMVCCYPVLFIPYGILGSIPYAFVFSALTDALAFGVSVPLLIYLMLKRPTKKKSGTPQSTPAAEVEILPRSPRVVDDPHQPVAANNKTSATNHAMMGVDSSTGNAGEKAVIAIV